jgi:hypothetical protein
MITKITLYNNSNMEISNQKEYINIYVVKKKIETIPIGIPPKKPIKPVNLNIKEEFKIVPHIITRCPMVTFQILKNLSIKSENNTIFNCEPQIRIVGFNYT